MSIKVMRCMLKGQRRCVLHDTDDLGVKARVALVLCRSHSCCETHITVRGCKPRLVGRQCRQVVEEIRHSFPVKV